MSRFLYRNLELLEPYEGKLSCTVLRGESSRKGADLPDHGIHETHGLILYTSVYRCVFRVQSCTYICCSPPPEPPLFTSSLLILRFTFLIASFKVPKR